MIKLLDDDDPEVVNTVRDSMLQDSEIVIPILEKLWFEDALPNYSNVIENVIQEIQFESLKSDVKSELRKDSFSPLNAWVLASRLEYPNISESQIKAHLNELKLQIWIKLADVNNPIDQIQILNHVFFEVFGFKGNNDNYHHIDNSIVLRVLETKKGNPISLSILYLTLANSLGIPLFGINLPQHFVLGYGQLKPDINKNRIWDFNEISNEKLESIIFYINPFSKGQIFTKESLLAFLKVIKINPNREFMEPCSSKDILMRMLRNISYAYEQQQKELKAKQATELLSIISSLDH